MVEKKAGKSKHGGARPGAGRKPGAVNKATRPVKELAQTYGTDAIRVIAGLMSDDSVSPAVRLAAASEILDRGYGRPSQYQEVKVAEADYPRTDELDAIYRAAMAKAAAGKEAVLRRDN